MMKWNILVACNLLSFTKLVLKNFIVLHFFKFFTPFLLAANTGLYAHYVFNTLDRDHTGILSFEVS